MLGTVKQIESQLREKLERRFPIGSYWRHPEISGPVVVIRHLVSNRSNYPDELGDCRSHRIVSGIEIRTARGVTFIVGTNTLTK